MDTLRGIFIISIDVNLSIASTSLSNLDFSNDKAYEQVFFEFFYCIKLNKYKLNKKLHVLDLNQYFF